MLKTIDTFIIKQYIISIFNLINFLEKNHVTNVQLFKRNSLNLIKNIK